MRQNAPPKAVSSRREAKGIHTVGLSDSWFQPAMEVGMDGKPLSMDLRSRALGAVDERMSCRAAARRFGVAAATVIRWHDQRRCTSGYAAKAQGGNTRSRRIDVHRDTILALHGPRCDITLDELRHELGYYEAYLNQMHDVRLVDAMSALGR